MRSRQSLLRMVLVLAAAWAGMGSGRKPDRHDPLPPRVEGWWSVKEFAREFGFQEVRVQEDSVWLQGQVHTLTLYKHSRRAELNGSRIWLNEGLSVRKGGWALSATDVRKTLGPVVRPVEALGGNGYRVVVLDPGHGDQDSGAVSPTGLMEKTVVLDITRKVRAELMGAGYQVYTTRHSDRFLSLSERTRRARAWKADLFVSIHANSGSKTARGVETYVLSLPGHPSTNAGPKAKVPTAPDPGNRFDESSMALGYAVHHALRSGTGWEDRGVRRARFQVLREAPCPAALVEVGFLTHPKEGGALGREEVRSKIAQSIALGIENYLRGVKQAVVMTESVTKKDET